MSIKLNQIKQSSGSSPKLKRVGRGNGSGTGGTAGRGHKGQRSRSGFSLITGFEGGQMPLYRRMPKNKGFKNPGQIIYQVVGIGKLAKFEDNTVIDKEFLLANSLINTVSKPVKILANGTITNKVIVKVEKISKKAQELILSAGGQCGEEA